MLGGATRCGAAKLANRGFDILPTLKACGVTLLACFAQTFVDDGLGAQAVHRHQVLRGVFAVEFAHLDPPLSTDAR
jgi:hypothetical protein